MPTADDFRTELRAQIDRAAKQGRPHIEVNAGELHRVLGGYPAKGVASHAMAECCRIMREELAYRNGEVVYETTSGQSASLTIRYYLTPK
jgi:5-methylcytosine-specific restriction protein A